MWDDRGVLLSSIKVAESCVSRLSHWDCQLFPIEPTSELDAAGRLSEDNGAVAL